MWIAGVNAAAGSPWDPGVMVVGYAFLRILERLRLPGRDRRGRSSMWVARRRPLRRIGAMGMLVALLSVTIVACDDHAEPVPPGAQVVHVVATESGVLLEPAAVRAGTVYLVLDEPLVGSFAFVERKRTAEETPGPLNDDDLERLAHGDTEGTSIGGLDAGGCGREQDAAERGLMGHCGNVMKVVVAAGKYAVLGPAWVERASEASIDPTAPPTGFVSPSSMAVLEVTP